MRSVTRPPQSYWHALVCAADMLFFFVERHALAGVIIASDDADAARRLSRTAAVLNISGFSFFCSFFFWESVACHEWPPR
jgi:hypothetical protein